MVRRAVPDIPSMRPEPKRDKWGRYVLRDSNGIERVYTRATTVAETLKDLYGLIDWKRRKAFVGAAIRPELLDRAVSLDRAIDDAVDWRDAKDAKSALNALCDEAAHAAGADDGSEWGTLLHTLTEYADAGRLPEALALLAEVAPGEVIADLLNDVAAYVTVMADAGIEILPEFIERILITPAVDAAGTTDRIVRMPEPCPDCGLFLRIADLKTQKTVDFGFLSMAIQEAEYANAEAMIDPETGEPLLPPVVCRCVGLVMHLPVGSGECTLYDIDLVQGWRYAQLAIDVRAARDASKSLGWKHQYASTTRDRVTAAADKARNMPAKPVNESPAEDPAMRQVRYLIANAPHRWSVEALVADLGRQGLITDELRTLARARWTELEAA